MPGTSRNLENVVDSQPGNPDSANDPFETHNTPAQRTWGMPFQLSRPAAPACCGGGDNTEPLTQGPPEKSADWGDPDRESWVAYTYVFIGWGVFMWALLLWLIVNHYVPAVVHWITVLLFLGSIGAICYGVFSKRAFTPSLLVIGVLCLLAVTGGTILGNIGWDQMMRSYWWLRTGRTFTGVHGSSSAAGNMDASVLEFASDTSVAYLMSAGYRDGVQYCVAPVLDDTVADSATILVQYWVVGVDCCQNFGSFTCGASRNPKGKYGIVKLDGGYPCPDCNNEMFRKATKKAETAYGLTSSDHALYLQWIEDKNGYMQGMLWGVIGFILVCAILGFLFLGSISYYVWRWGIGKASPLDYLGVRDPREMSP